MSSSEGVNFFRPWSQGSATAEEEEEVQVDVVDTMVKQEVFGCCTPSDEDSLRSSSVESQYAEHRQMYHEGVASAPAHWSSQGVVYHNSWPVPLSWDPSSFVEVQEAVIRVHAQEAAAKHIKKLRPKKFQCSDCDMAFSNNGQLKGHQRIHTGERPFKCDFESCGKTFTRNEELTRHKRIHTGERPHVCHVCRKSFGRKDHLKKHLKTHENRQVCQLTAAAAAQYVGFHYPALAASSAFGLPTLPYF